MKITAEQLHRKWNSIDYYDGGYIQIEVQHPLDWFVGYEKVSQKTLLIISEKEPELLPTSKSIIVSKRLRTDNKWTLLLTLMRAEQESVFETLCADIITYSGTAEDESSALSLTLKRYKQWNKLLEYQKKGLMDESGRKGLLGELIYLCHVIKNGYPVLSAVQGWVGPDGADQDFVYADGWHEIKSVGLSAASITISSLEQLDREDPGELVVMRIDKCAPECTGAFSLGDQVDVALELIKSDPDALSLMERKLASYGYIDLPEYREQKYIFSGESRFIVDSSFPRLTGGTTPAQVISAQYVISIAGIEDWRLEE